MRIDRIWAMPNKWTFQIPPIAALLKEEMTGGIWIDPFAGKSSPAHIKNDLNPKCSAAYHMDALEFLKLFDNDSADGILYDPPYSPRQVRECYDNIDGNIKWDGKVNFWSDTKNEIARILKPNGATSEDQMGCIPASNPLRLEQHGHWQDKRICNESYSACSARRFSK